MKNALSGWICNIYRTVYKTQKEYWNSYSQTINKSGCITYRCWTVPTFLYVSTISLHRRQMDYVVDIFINMYTTACGQDTVSIVAVVWKVVNCFIVILLSIIIMQHWIDIVTVFRVCITPAHLCTGHSSNQTSTVSTTPFRSALTSHQFNYRFFCWLQVSYNSSRASTSSTAPTVCSRFVAYFFWATLYM